MKTEIYIQVPLRVASKKNTKHKVATGATIYSKAFRQFEKDAALYIRKAKLAAKLNGPMPGPYEVEIWYSAGGNMLDGDNMETSLFDVLQKVEVIDDDKNIWDCHWHKNPFTKKDYVAIRIKSLPENYVKIMTLFYGARA